MSKIYRVRAAILSIVLVATVFTNPAAGFELWLQAPTELSETPPDRGIVRAFAETGEDIAEILEFETAVPGRLEVELPHSGEWRFELEAERYWAPEVSLVPEAGVAQVWRLQPTTVVEGSVLLGKEGELPEQITFGFRALPEKQGQESAFEGEVSCPLDEEGSFSCRVAAGRLDLALRAEGFVSHYFWALELEPWAEKDLGALELRPGASLVGWVETADGSPITEDAHVRLAPMLSPNVEPELAGRARSLQLRAPVNERGFFQIAGVEIGAYRLIAEQEGFAPLKTPKILVSEAREKELPETLVLHRPLELELEVVPPLDIRGRRWRVALVRLGDPEAVAQAWLSEEGRWRRPGLEPGRYQVMINDSQGSRVGAEWIDLAPGESEVLIELPVVRVEGRVSLGEEPLEAEIAFGGRSGSVSIALASGEEGFFEGIVPREGEWDVDVRSTDPKVNRRLRKVPVEVNPALGVAVVDLELPDTLLEGEVVDEGGAPVEGAAVISLPLPAVEKPSTAFTDEEGHFELRGFATGSFRIEARAQGPRGTMTSEAVELELSEDDPTASVRLVVRDVLQLRGRVISTTGSVVAGAALTARPVMVEGLPAMILPMATSGTDGGYVLELPPGAAGAEITIMAPGFVLTRREVAADPSKTLDLVVEPQDRGGTLRLSLAERIGDGFEGRGHPYVLHDGVERYSVGTLRNWAFRSGVIAPGAEMAVPAMPAGAWALCRPGKTGSPADHGSQCSEGFLAPTGELKLEEPGSAPEENSAISF